MLISSQYTQAMLIDPLNWIESVELLDAVNVIGSASGHILIGDATILID